MAYCYKNFGQSRQNRRFLLAALLLVSFLSAAIRSEEVNSQSLFKLQKEKQDQVSIAPVVEKKFSNVKNTTGKIAFNDDLSTPVFTPFTGRIIKLNFKVGEKVIKGDILLEMDTQDMVGFESDLLNAMTASRKALQVKNMAQHSKEITQCNLQLLKKTLEIAQSNESRQRSLYEEKAVSLRDWEQAQHDEQQAERDHQQGQKDFTQAETDLTNAEHEYASTVSQLRTMRDRLVLYGKSDEEIQKIESTQITDHVARIVAPISGVVISRKVGLGQFVKPDNPDPICVINDLTTKWMLADVYETDVSSIKTGQEVEVSVPAYPAERFNAKVTYVGTSVDPNTRRLPVRCEIPDLENKLKAEMFASFRIVIDLGSNTAGVPKSAVFINGSQYYVWKAITDESFQRNPVTTGLEQDGLVQIVEGLKPGERVVSRGALLITSEQDTP